MVKKDHSIQEELTILAKSQEFPDTTLFLRKDFPSAKRLQLRDILLSRDRDAEWVEVLKKLEAMKFVAANKSDFQPCSKLP